MGNNQRDEYRREERGHETILVVEDNEPIRLLAKVILSRKGYSVLSAESGVCALEILHSSHTPIHLLLADLVMPGMNGKDLYAQAKKIQESIKVVYMSGYTYDLVMEKREIEAGVHFIQKPFSIESLVTEVRNALDH